MIEICEGFNGVTWAEDCQQASVFVLFVYSPGNQYVNRHLVIWVVTWEIVPSDVCARRRLKSACAFTQSDQFSLSAWRNFASLAIEKCTSEDSDQIARRRRLIWMFAGRICLRIGFFDVEAFWRWDSSYIHCTKYSTNITLVPSLYRHSLQRQNALYWQFDCHETFA